jgi:hypothetical protein
VEFHKNEGVEAVMAVNQVEDLRYQLKVEEKYTPCPILKSSNFDPQQPTNDLLVTQHTMNLEKAAMSKKC